MSKIVKIEKIEMPDECYMCSTDLSNLDPYKLTLDENQQEVWLCDECYNAFVYLGLIKEVPEKK